MIPFLRFQNSAAAAGSVQIRRENKNDRNIGTFNDLHESAQSEIIIIGQTFDIEHVLP